MTDDEVKAWLTDEERHPFDLLCSMERGAAYGDEYAWLHRGGSTTIRVFRSLAETRKALHGLGWRSEGMWVCPLCAVRECFPICIFATMPRPK